MAIIRFYNVNFKASILSFDRRFLFNKGLLSPVYRINRPIKDAILKA